MISQKTQYALRAIFELARWQDKKPIKIGAVAEKQSIPVRFLEVILSQLKQGGFVESRRGADGGYLLIRQPQELTVGEVIRFVQGPIGPVDCISDPKSCGLYGDCAFSDLWSRVNDAIASVYDTTTFQDLIDDEEKRRGDYVPTFSI